MLVLSHRFTYSINFAALIVAAAGVIDLCIFLDLAIGVVRLGFWYV